MAAPAGGRGLASTTAAPETAAETWPTDAARRAAFGNAPSLQEDGVAAMLTGRLPPWLAGELFRNGPGDFTRKNHW